MAVKKKANEEVKKAEEKKLEEKKLPDILDIGDDFGKDDVCMKNPVVE